MADREKVIFQSVMTGTGSCIVIPYKIKPFEEVEVVVYSLKKKESKNVTGRKKTKINR